MIDQTKANQLALKFFGKSLPMTPDELKSSFRAAAKRLHTDTSGQEATKEMFIQMNQFYQELQKVSWAITGGNQPKKTGSGDLLSELGLGLGPLKNGRDCVKCDHKGYTEEHSSGFVNCQDCFGGWTYSQKCNMCRGSGKYIKNRVVGVCFACHGTKIYTGTRLQRCESCKGDGGKSIKTGTIIYHTCYDCKGTGEIEIHNPVIPKGWLT